MELLVICTIRFSPDEEWLKREKQRQSLRWLRAGLGSLVGLLIKFGIPWRSHHAAPAVSQSAIIREAPFLGAWSTVPLLPHSLLPVVTFHHNLSARGERLKKQKRKFKKIICTIDELKIQTQTNCCCVSGAQRGNWDEALENLLLVTFFGLHEKMTFTKKSTVQQY